MAIVAGVDFGTLSVRVSIVDSERGLLASAIGGISAASQTRRSRVRHSIPRRPHARAGRGHARGCQERRSRRRPGRSDRAGHNRVFSNSGRQKSSAARRILPLVRPSRQRRSRRNHRGRAPRRAGSDQWCGGVYSSEWGFSKLLHWLRHNPRKRSEFASAFEHCDMVAATLCGITDPKKVKRSICAMGHKWLWNAHSAGFRPKNS